MDVYIVKKNETIDDIASKFNLKVTDLLNVNDINVYDLKEGDEINIPFILSNDFFYYEVKDGDTLENIVTNKNLDVKTIAQLNGLDATDYIYPKQVLILPRDNVNIYITQKGDTIGILEKKLGYDIEKIKEDNPDIYLMENQLVIERNGN